MKGKIIKTPVTKANLIYYMIKGDMRDTLDFFWCARNLVTSNTENLSFSCRTPLLMLCNPHSNFKGRQKQHGSNKKQISNIITKQVKDFVSQIKNNPTNFNFRLFHRIKKIYFSVCFYI